MSRTKVTNLPFIFLGYFPLMVSDDFYFSCPLGNLNTLCYIIMTLYSYRAGHDDVSRTRMTTVGFMLSDLFPLVVSDAVSCRHHNLNTLWYIITILYSYDQKVIAICHVQE